MASSSARRGLLLGILITIMPAAGNAAAEDAPCRRWGLGWGDWTLPVFAGDSRGPALRHRTPSGWTFTVYGSLATDNDESGEQGQNSYSEYGEIREAEGLTRVVGCELGRHYRLHERFSLGPALRLGHGYERSESRRESLQVYDDPFDWRRSVQTRRDRSEAYWFGLGLRPQLWLHSRVSVETGLFLDYWRTHERDESWTRENDLDGDSAEYGGTNTWKGDGWRFSFASPSVSMGLTLFFYF